MREVYERLWVGCDADVSTFLAKFEEKRYIVHAAKEPWHRKACGYKTPGAPPGDSYRHKFIPGGVTLNLIDAPTVDLIDRGVIMIGVGAIAMALRSGLNVLVHCNKGTSRAPGLAYLYLRNTYGYTLEEFRNTYPDFKPGRGMSEYITNNF